MDFILIVLIFIVLIIIGIIFSILIVNYNDYTIKQYYTDLPTTNNKNEVCPHGCVRGACNHNLTCINPIKDNCCIYDFQCNNCIDPITNNYYTDKTINKKLNVKYDLISPNNDIQKIKDLNQKIRKQNLYIAKLNQEVNNMNKLRGY